MATQTQIPDEVFDRHFPTAAGLVMDALAVTPVGRDLIDSIIRRLADQPREDHYRFVEERVEEMVLMPGEMAGRPRGASYLDEDRSRR